MREITFTAGDDEGLVWKDLYQAFMMGEVFLTGHKAIASCGKVYEALESVALKDQGGLRLSTNGGTIRLEDAQYETLKDATDNVLVNGLHQGVARGLPVMRALNAARTARVLSRIKDAPEHDVIKARADETEPVMQKRRKGEPLRG